MTITKPPIIAVGLSALFPLLMGANTDGQPQWIPLVVSSLSALGGYGLILAGRAASAYLRQKAKSLREMAAKANEQDAVEDLARAAGLDAVADILEHKVPQK